MLWFALTVPPVLDGWEELGPIGVAMALLAWCGSVGTGWVVTACVGAALWERNAPSQTVVESQVEVEPQVEGASGQPAQRRAVMK